MRLHTLFVAILRSLSLKYQAFIGAFGNMKKRTMPQRLEIEPRMRKRYCNIDQSSSDKEISRLRCELYLPRCQSSMCFAHLEGHTIPKETSNTSAGPPDTSTKWLFVSGVILSDNNSEDWGIRSLKNTQEKPVHHDACEVLAGCCGERNNSPQKDHST